jgi:hypothetical protein
MRNVRASCSTMICAIEILLGVSSLERKEQSVFDDDA